MSLPVLRILLFSFLAVISFTVPSFAALPENTPARVVLDRVVALSLTTQPSSQALANTLEFETIFQSMTSGEVMRALIFNDLAAGYRTYSSYQSAIASRGIDLSILRPYGILTALGTADGGPLLGGPSLTNVPMPNLPTATRDMLETRFSADRLTFLNAFTQQNLLRLFDDRVSAVSTVSDPVYAYAWRGSRSNIIAAANLYIGTVGKNVSGVPMKPPFYPEPAIIKAATDLNPAGHRLIHINNFWVRYNERLVAGRLECETDPCQEIPPNDQTTVRYNNRDYKVLLPWMDSWAGAMRSRFNNFFQAYKALGGTVDVALLDVEDYSFQGDTLFNVSGLPQSVVWETIRNDPRWNSELRPKLLAAGLTENDLSASATPWTWFGAKDYRTCIWGKVMQERLSAYFNQAVYGPISAAERFPNVSFSTFRDFYHSHEGYANNHLRMNSSWHGVGMITGSAQAPSIYSDGLATSPFGMPASTLHQSGKVGVQDITVAVSPPRLTLRLTEDLLAPRAGEPAMIVEGAKKDANGNAFDPAPFLGLRTVSSHPDLRSYVFNFTGPATSRSSVSGYPLLNLKFLNQYGQFVGMLRKIRSSFLAANVPVRPVFPSRERLSLEWLGTPMYAPFEYYSELIFHAVLHGSVGIEFWNSEMAGADELDDALMNDSIVEVNSLVGFRGRRPLPFQAPEWTDDYVLSGMEAKGVRYFRLTPNWYKYTSFNVVPNSSPLQVRLYSGTTLAKTLTLPNMVVHSIANPISSPGIWLRSTSVVSYLTEPASQVRDRL